LLRQPDSGGSLEGRASLTVMVDVSFTMLSTLRALAQYQNVAQAAEALHMTQSGLAQSISALEK
jgi:Bacterial regulatory helix-turn-helix protein, lysR family